MSESPQPIELLPDGMLVLDKPSPLPPVLDMLIVGGGPFGTAAAFRASELGLSVLVVDYDDLMKRIRDYAKDKLILPDFGGGERMQFPIGGEMIAALQFEAIDKDDMCVRWKGLYRRFNVPAQIGVEMTGLERQGDVWQLNGWNHTTKAQQTIKARHVVLAFGRGVPRRLDVPGDVAGLAFALTKPSVYVGGPCCVLGGGTSAAEAVIAISKAKAAAGDHSAVYWSYRGDRMPKVSKALADSFFEAFMIHGNVRYLPNSEPATMLEVGGDKFLAIRTSRAVVEGHPPETTQLEFKKGLCLACIGEDIPEALLESIKVPLVAVGPGNKKRIVVSPILETRQPNLYLAGDVLSPVYFETTDFDADPATFVEIKRRGNIKAALRDGVLVAEAIAQKIAGQQVIKVQMTFQTPATGQPKAAAPGQAKAPAAPAKPVTGEAKQDVDNAMTVALPNAGLGTPAVKALEPPPPGCTLVSILASGVEANEYPIRENGKTTIGRRGTDIAFPDDAALADVHASIMAENGTYQVRDEGSALGVFLRPDKDRTLTLGRGAILRIGTQWLVVGDKQSPGALIHHDATGKRIARVELPERTVVVGRESPDITIAANDSALSRRHVAFTLRKGVVTVKDLRSANGTLLKVTGPVTLADGDRLIIGQQVLRFNDERVSTHPPVEVTVASGHLPRIPEPAPAPEARKPQVAAAAPAAPPPQGKTTKPVDKPGAPIAAPAPAEPAVTFSRLNRRVACTKGQTICDVAEAAGIKLDADCHQGVCGMDPVIITAGAEFLNAMTSTEKNTLEDICSLEPGRYRLACVSRVSGPVTAEIVKQ